MRELEENTYLLLSLFQYDSGKLYWKIKPCKNIDNGQEAGGIHILGYHRIAYNRKRYATHRLIWIYHNGKIPNNYTIDHIDRNKLNNKIENLRLATKSQQQWNTGIMNTNNTGIIGVCWSKSSNKWHAYINKKGHKRLDKFFSDINDAIIWRETMKTMLHEYSTGIINENK